ncbi:MAG: PAC2 family protein, partial [Acidimicrobiia bacterium]|nr:PAC2 family protein [Acidimicrobiia bacterium]
MSSELVIVHREFDLADPVLVVALDGWVDAGIGMRNATEIMVKADDAALVASFDADLLVDHRARRPTMTVREGRVDDISWPAIRLQQVSDLDQRPFLVLHGPEPDFRWQAFCIAVDELVQRLGVSRVVALGAYPA